MGDADENSGSKVSRASIAWGDADENSGSKVSK